ncbi:MAG: hypothetical protein M9948_13140 [Lentimicrobium sp.]|nr:hypothetical protein [Lentimicrobium sp.]
MKTNTNQLGGDNTITANAFKTIVELQRNDNEQLREHICQLGKVVLWIGRNLDGFDPDNQDDQQALRSIVALSNVAAMLQSLEAV